MEPIVSRGLLVGSNMESYARHSSQAGARLCQYVPCKCPFPGSTRRLFKTSTPPFWQWDRRRTRAGNTRCTHGWNSLQCLWTSTNPGYDSLRQLPCTARPSDIRVYGRAPRKRQRRARDEETRQMCMGTYHRQTFWKDNKWRYTQVKYNRCVHLFCWCWACTNTNTQPRHTIIEARNSHMDTKCDGSPDNCAECRLTTMHCLFILDVFPIGDCCERNTQTQDRSKNIRSKDQSACTCTNTVHIPTCSLSGRPSNTNRSSKNYMVNSSFACLHVVLRLTIDLAILVPLYWPKKCR